MPIIKSAKKRVKTANKAAIRNSKSKRTLKTAVKSFHAALTGKSKDAGTKQSKVQSELDKAVKKGILHKNKAARLKKQAATKAKAAGVKPAAKAKKAAPAKKAAAPKKVAAKKPAAKKAPAKKK
ncbi:MAG: ribosomal protein [Candidatus Saccharibacteria bacterium]|nr:ribosomal protein [Candidatus Saccharibacteria bacterium]